MARGRGLNQRGKRQARGRVKTSPAPFDATALRESSTLTAEGADERAALQAGYAKAQSQLGFGAGAGNPYGASEENKSNLANAQRANLNTAGNSLYSGATLNAASAARSTYDKTQKRIEDEASQAQDQYTGGIASTARDEAVGQVGIKGEAIERAAATEPAPLAPGRRKAARTPRARGRVGANLNPRRGRGRV